MCTNYKEYTSIDGVFHISSSLCIVSQIACTNFEASDSKFILLFQKLYLCQTEIKHEIEIWYCTCSLLKSLSFFKQTPTKKRSSFTGTVQSKRALPTLMCRLSLHWESQTFQNCVLGTLFFLNPGIVLSAIIRHNQFFSAVSVLSYLICLW